LKWYFPFDLYRQPPRAISPATLTRFAPIASGKSLYVLKFPYRRLLGPLAASLPWVHPDVLSYLATGVTLGTAACYIHGGTRPVLLLGAIVLPLLRMTLNTLDGVIAIRRGNLSLKGEIVNALPDRHVS